MDDELREFLAWEKTCRGAVDFKPIYVDMADDLIAGLMLSQLVYWCLLPDKKGKSRLRVRRDGHMWAAKSRSEWWDEIRLTPKQADRAIRVLANRGLVVRKNSLFNGKRTTHLRINWHVFRDAWLNRMSAPEQALDPRECDPDDDPGETPLLTEGPQQYPPKGDTGVDQRSTPITETTAEPTTNSTTEAAASILGSTHNAPIEPKTRDGGQRYRHQLRDGKSRKGRPRRVDGKHGPQPQFTLCPQCWHLVDTRHTCDHGCRHCCPECFEPNQEKTS